MWHETGSVTYDGEFKQWLHVFSLERSTRYEDSVPSVHITRSLPWLNLMPKPCIETLTAMHHMTQMRQYPPAWRDWRYIIQEVTLEARHKEGNFGPYWALMKGPGLQMLAQEMVSIKRRIQNEMFRDADPWSARNFERRVIESMEPFLIYPMEKT